MSIRFKTVSLVILLTGVFLGDDVLIYLLLKNMFEWKVNPFILAMGATIVLGLNLSLAILIFNIMRKRPTTGQQGMIGEVGVVLKKVNRQAKIKIHGEIWTARCDKPLKAGEKVMVERVEGLTLVVKKLA